MPHHPLATLRVETDADIVRLRQVASEIAVALKFGNFAKTRAVTALLELARNAIEYAGGGSTQLSLGEHSGVLTLEATLGDQGSGIQSLDNILAGNGVTSKGLGLGLRGVKRIADKFAVVTGSEGTRIDISFCSELSVNSLNDTLAQAKTALSSMATLDPAAALAEQNRELLDAVASRDLLMQEIHHRTANNLALIGALIRMSTRQATSDETKQILKDLDTRVSAVTTAHQHLQKAQQGDSLATGTFLSGVAQSAAQAFNSPDLEVHIRYSGDDLMIDGGTAIDLGLIVNELVTNAYKHAFKGRALGRIVIGLQRTTNGSRLSVADDGCGLPDGAEKLDKSDSLGWRLIRLKCRQHGGTIEIDGDDGFEVNVQFSKSLDAPVQT